MDEPKNQAAATVSVEWGPQPLAVHANFSTIFSGLDGFLLTFAAILPGLGKSFGQEQAGPRAQVVSVVHLTPEVFFQFSKASVEAWEKFRAQNAPDAPSLKLTVEEKAEDDQR